ncbi:MAG: proline--tRNA ligase [Pseudanabaenaceae cyanobacterium SKYGB_i_bin29]|nr:proline--tRNA ligase [Pseudanabaenaceae cyanobacterium SKYG29]MDW8422024.1 proline--tRNA ligase [Pseudanabaenaceae cyanobacterium SKYGB_i_bin29]
MRLSQMLWVTLREDPADAELPSHKLLVRAGYIRRIANGIYAYLPLMWRVLQKISDIVREEMHRSGAQECLLPQLQPAELWQTSGRWDTYTKAEGIMFSLTDRAERQLGLGPTHEEVITAIAKDMIRSYRQLPLHLYQIQTKFRDEIRPRFGLLRGREFIMKDGYSFHTNEASLKETYQEMYNCYSRILRRCGLEFRAVEADSGAIGGSGSQEFMILAEAGEDQVLYTEDGQYAANVEKAVSLPPDPVVSSPVEFRRVAAPNTATIETMAAFLQVHPTQIVKQVVYQAVLDNGKTLLVLVSIRGDQTVNEVKLANEITKRANNYGAKTLLSLKVADAESQKQWQSQPLPVGYIAPDLSDDYIAKHPAVIAKFLRLADRTVVDLHSFATGSNATDFHVVGANWGKEYVLPEVVDIRLAQAGDRAVHDPSQTLKVARGIEVGHIFQLGTKYSQAMGATFTDETGAEIPLVMGCYGLGVSRLAQAAVEQSHDQNGIIWDVAIAPYQVIIAVPNITNPEQMAVAEKLYQALQQAGMEVLLDDRDERAGVKFKDADLVGIPYRLVPGKSIAQGEVEIFTRKTGKTENVAIDRVVDWLREAIRAALAK